MRIKRFEKDRNRRNIFKIMMFMVLFIFGIMRTASGEESESPLKLLQGEEKITLTKEHKPAELRLEVTKLKSKELKGYMEEGSNKLKIIVPSEYSNIKNEELYFFEGNYKEKDNSKNKVSSIRNYSFENKENKIELQLEIGFQPRELYIVGYDKNSNKQNIYIIKDIEILSINTVAPTMIVYINNSLADDSVIQFNTNPIDIFQTIPNVKIAGDKLPIMANKYFLRSSRMTTYAPTITSEVTGVTIENCSLTGCSLGNNIKIQKKSSPITPQDETYTVYREDGLAIVGYLRVITLATQLPQYFIDITPSADGKIDCLIDIGTMTSGTNGNCKVLSGSSVINKSNNGNPFDMLFESNSSSNLTILKSLNLTISGPTKDNTPIQFSKVAGTLLDNDIATVDLGLYKQSAFQFSGGKIQIRIVDPSSTPPPKITVYANIDRTASLNHWFDLNTLSSPSISCDITYTNCENLKDNIIVRGDGFSSGVFYFNSPNGRVTDLNYTFTQIGTALYSVQNKIKIFIATAPSISRQIFPIYGNADPTSSLIGELEIIFGNPPPTSTITLVSKSDMDFGEIQLGTSGPINHTPSQIEVTHDRGFTVGTAYTITNEKVNNAPILQNSFELTQGAEKILTVSGFESQVATNGTQSIINLRGVIENVPADQTAIGNYSATINATLTAIPANTGGQF